MVAYQEGQVALDGQPLEASLTHFADVKENGVLETEQGRAEVLLNPGVVLRLGENSSLKMITNRLIDTRVELVKGSAVVDALEVGKDTSVTVVTANAAVTLPKAGIYRFDTQPAAVKVFKGSADVEIGGEFVPVATGRMLSLDDASAKPEKFDTEDTDALDRWSHRRSEYMAMANVSSARQSLLSGSTFIRHYPEALSTRRWVAWGRAWDVCRPGASTCGTACRPTCRAAGCSWIPTGFPITARLWPVTPVGFREATAGYGTAAVAAYRDHRHGGS